MEVSCVPEWRSGKVRKGSEPEFAQKGDVQSWRNGTGDRTGTKSRWTHFLSRKVNKNLVSKTNNRKTV